MLPPGAEAAPLKGWSVAGAGRCCTAGSWSDRIKIPKSSLTSHSCRSSAGALQAADWLRFSTRTAIRRVVMLVRNPKTKSIRRSSRNSVGGLLVRDWRQSFKRTVIPTTLPELYVMEIHSEVMKAAY
mmetsp:Transcript_12327/g.23208  ORF Transcript_12327/g.23208 Transcript_12327/m.23208 type:complete len:127 (-) Transcript_12327:146-526(-)